MLIALIAFFLPGFLGVPFRKLLGAKIGHGSSIGIFSLVHVRDLKLGTNSRITSFSVIKAKKLDLGNSVVIKGPCLVKAAEITLGDFSSISPLAVVNAPLIEGANLSMGSHSQIFPFCWLEPGEGIEIGNQVGIGGHTLIFTHGSWTNYLEGGPVSFGKVKIEDGVWLPWRVFILPGVTIGANAIIAAHSTVSKSLPARSLVGGAPAKVIKEDFVMRPSPEERLKRLEQLIAEFPKFMGRKWKRVDSSILKIDSGPGLSIVAEKARLDFEGLSFTNPENNDVVEEFVAFIRRYGIRMSRIS